MELYLTAGSEAGLSRSEIEGALLRALDGRSLRNVLILPPDFTRYHSGAGYITSFLYRTLTARGCNVDILPALGTHEPVSRRQAEVMFEGVPYEKLSVHNWRTDVERLGEASAEEMGGLSDGLFCESVSVELNCMVLDSRYDLIVSPGQVVPHEVIGMSNHSKNLFVGVGGSDMINKSHMLGAVYGMERMMGRDNTPVRRLFDRCAQRFLAGLPLLYILTVTTAPEGEIRTHGLFIGEGRQCLTEAAALSRRKNIDFIDGGVQKCVVYLDPAEFKSTWLGNKAVYRTRMAVQDGGELIILAPGVRRFGEDDECDRLIRKYGYRGREAILSMFGKNADLRANMSAAAHLIHGSSDGRFKVTYAVDAGFRSAAEGVGYAGADYATLAARYDTHKLKYGRNTVAGEEIFFIPNPALGLWIDRERFGADI